MYVFKLFFELYINLRLLSDKFDHLFHVFIDASTQTIQD